MKKAGKITSVNPVYSVPGGEVAVECNGFEVNKDRDFACYIGGERCRLKAVSADRVLAVVPERPASNPTLLQLVSGGESGEPIEVRVGKSLVSNMHMVGNPAVDPSDDSIIVTRSGSRGEQLPGTMFRYEADGFLDQMPVKLLNPSGIAFDPAGELFVTNRSDGEVVRIDNDDEAVVVASGLGIATGIAFDGLGVMYVGDRSGTIFRVGDLGHLETFAVLEPSVSAYHLAFGPDGRLYVTAPGLASYDSIYAIEPDGEVERYFRGFGRPQGIAFDTEGNLYAAACYKGRHGIVRIDAAGESCEVVTAVSGAVGLCFTRKGEMIVATGSELFSIDAGIYGTLLS
jgi:sugar lactone lactonase YvrE